MLNVYALRRAWMVLAVLTILAGNARALLLEPPSDIGVLREAWNFNYDVTRGAVFMATEDRTLDGFAYHLIAEGTAYYKVSQIEKIEASGYGVETILASGSIEVNQPEMGWVLFDHDDVALQAGLCYAIAVRIEGTLGIREYYHLINWFSAGPLSSIWGLLNDRPTYVTPVIEVFFAEDNAPGTLEPNQPDDPVVPKPTTLALIGLGMASLAPARRRLLRALN